MAEMAAAVFTWVVDTGAKAIAALGVSEATAQAVSAVVVEAAVTMAASAAVSAFVAPDIGVEGRPTTVSWSPDAGNPYIMGRRASAGLLVMQDEFGADNRYMSEVRMYSRYGPAQSISGTKVNKIATSFDGSGNASSGSDFRDKLWRTTQLGAQPEAGHLYQAGLHQNAVMANWGSDYKLSGCAAAIYTRYENSKNNGWPSGPPDYLEVIENGVGYDPRLDSTYPGGSGAHRWGTLGTYAYSTNGAIQALNYALGLYENGLLVEGLGIDIADIDLDSFVEAANVADLNGWTCHAAWTSKDNKREVFKGMLQAAGARPAFIKGKLGAVSIGAQKVSLTTITAADTAGPISIKAFGARIGRKNTITPRCVLEDHDWEMIDLEPVSAAAYVTEDGEEVRQTSVSFPFVTDAVQARELAAYIVANSREGMATSIPLKPYHLDLQPGDCFTIDEPGFNLSSLKVQVLERTVDMQSGVAVLQVISETDGKHPFAQGLTTTPPTAPSLVEDNTYVRVDPPQSDWDTPVPGTITNPITGGVLPVFVITGDVQSPRVRFVQVEYSYRSPDGLGGWGAWSDWRFYGEFRADVTRIEILGLPSGAQVQVRITYITDYDQPSDAPLVLDPVVFGTYVADDAAAVAGRVASDVLETLDETKAKAADTVRKLDDLRAETAAMAAGLWADVEERFDDVESIGYDLNAETSARVAAVQSVADDLVQETADRAAAVQAVADDLVQESADRAAAISATETNFATDLASTRANLAENNRRLEDFTWNMAVQFAGVDAAVEEVAGLAVRTAAAEGAIVQEQSIRATEDSILSARIDNISAAFLEGDIEALVATETTARINADNALATDISNLQSRVTATEGDITTVQGDILTEQSARASGDSANAASITALTGRVTVVESDLATAQTDITTVQSDLTSEQSARASGDSANASDITALTSRVTTAEGEIATAQSDIVQVSADLVTEQSTRASADSANASAISSLDARVTQNEGDITTANATIASDASARVTADAALARRLDGLIAETAAGMAAAYRDIETTADQNEVVATRITGLQAATDANAATIASEETARISGDNANATAIGLIDARVTAAEGDIITANAAIASESSARASGDSANAADITALTARISTAEGEIDTAQADILSLSEARVTGDAALARRLDGLVAELAGAFAGVHEEQEARADETEGLATRLTVLSGRMGSAEAELISLDEARAAGDSALTVSLDALTARVTTTEDDIAATDGDVTQLQADLVAEQSARASGDSANASDITALTARVTTAEGEIDTAQADIVAEQAARASGDSANASDITALTARVTTTEGDVDTLETDLATAQADIVSERSVRASADAAAARERDDLLVSIAASLAGVFSEVETSASETEALSTRLILTAAEVADNAAAIIEESSARATGDSANATEISALAARVTTTEGDTAANAAAITAEQSARASGDNANASDITALTARVTTTEGDISTAQADIVAEQSARASGDSANASAISGLTARMDTAEGDIDAAEAAITAEQSARASGDSANATAISALDTRLGTAEAAIVSEESARISADNANASAISGLSVRMDAAEGDITTNAADIVSEQSARASGDAANASSISALDTRLTSAEGDILTRATIAQLNQVESDAASARASMQTALQAGIDSNTASVGINASAIAELEGGAAWFEILVAAGADPAIARLLAGKNGSEIFLAATKLILANMGSGENEFLPVMEASGGEAFFSRPVYIAGPSGSGVHTIFGLFGPSSEEMFIWSGPDTIAAAAATRGNGYFALGIDGRTYYGSDGANPWKQYAQQTHYADDGDAVSFNPPYSSQPAYAVDANTLKGRGEDDSLSVVLKDWITDGNGDYTGATFEGKITRATTISQHVTTTSTGFEPIAGCLTLAKYASGSAELHAEDAYNGRYFYEITGTIAVVNNGEFIDGSITVDFFAWTVGTGQIPTTRIRKTLTAAELGISLTAQTGIYGFTKTVAIDIANMIGGGPGGASHFAALAVSELYAGGNMTGLSQVTWSSQSTGTVVSAVPTGGLATITTRPA